MINSNATSVSYINGDLYMTGSIASTSSNNFQYAAYWKNGVVAQLSTTELTLITALAIVP